MYDITTSTLLAVQRFAASSGPVSCMAVSIHADHMAELLLATAPRGPEGGGLLLDPTGLPWRSPPYRQLDHDTKYSKRAASPLLCVASEQGWLKVYQVTHSGHDGWQLVHAVNSLAPVHGVCFSPWGETLAVATPAAQVLGMEAVAVAAGGSQPGCVSLYDVSTWQLQQQWSLRSTPQHCLFLPGCHVQLIDGKRVAAQQVLYLLVTMRNGQPVVLHTTKVLDAATNNIQPQQQQQQQAESSSQAPQAAGQQTVDGSIQHSGLPVLHTALDDVQLNIAERYVVCLFV
eukprot:jgi/Chrzof1/3943/Cz13g14110.t1